MRSLKIFQLVQQVPISTYQDLNIKLIVNISLCCHKFTLLATADHFIVQSLEPGWLNPPNILWPSLLLRKRLQHGRFWTASGFFPFRTSSNWRPFSLQLQQKVRRIIWELWKCFSLQFRGVTDGLWDPGHPLAQLQVGGWNKRIWRVVHVWQEKHSPVDFF